MGDFMNLSDLQSKEVIDISTGKRMGLIIDVIVNLNGNISKLVLEDRKINRKILGSSKDEIYLEWNKIIRIGDDIILVDNKKE